ncbi:MAG: glycoside hydrolase family 9 protein [Candidatus Paceibacterota bacterium]|jgi:hypothetical protein
MSNLKRPYPLLAIILIVFVFGSAFLFSSSNFSLFSRLSNQLNALVVNIFNEPGSNSTGENVQLVNDPALSYQSQNALKFFFPNQWHYTARLDFSNVTMKDGDTFNFYIRTASSTYANSLIAYLSYSGSSDQTQDIDLGPYLSGGQVDTSYKLVSIPYGDLKGNFKGNFRHFNLRVPSDQYQVAFYVDKIFLDIKEVVAPVIPSPVVATSSSVVTNTNSTSTTTTTVTPITTTTTQIVLFNDFPSNLTFKNVTAVNDSKLAHTGSWLFAFAPPDMWHPWAWIFFNTFYPKADSNLQFYIRTKSGTYSDSLLANFYYSGSSDQTQDIDLLSYLVPSSQITQKANRQLAAVGAVSARGQVNTSYQLVSIPVSALHGNYKGYFRHFSLKVPANKTPITFYLDDLNFLNGSGTGLVTPPPTATSTPIIDEPVVTPPTPALKGILLWDGESEVSRVAGVFSKGQAINTVASSSGWSFEGQPDQWRNAQISLKGQPMYRKGISQYDEIWFYAKANSLERKIIFQVSNCCGRSSTALDANNYIEGGKLDTTWRLVRIPLKDLKTPDYLLENIQYLAFGKASDLSGYKIYIDNVYVVDTTPIKISGYKFLSDRVIKLTTNERYDFDMTNNASNYALSSNDDSEFSAGVNPAKVGREFFTSNFVENGLNGVYGDAGDPVTTSYIYLVFDKPLKNGDSYSLKINNIKNKVGLDLSSPIDIGFTYNDLNNIAGSVKANQVGYLPVSSKIGYAGNYLGDLNELDINPTICEVRNSSNKSVVFSTTMKYRGTNVQFFGEKIYTCDFSSFTVPGTYFLYVPGVGRTYDFKIANDIYNDVATKLARAYYYQRSGIDLLPKYAGTWARAGGRITNDGAIIAASQQKSSLYDNELLGSSIKMPAGWFDAGDYGRYVTSGSASLNEIFTAFELFSQKFKDGALNIPESGDGVPDILNEAKWEMDWLKEMQAPDGGVYHKVATLGYTGDMPVNDVAEMRVAEKDTHTTALYAAALAQGYRAFKPYFPAYADELLARSIKAYKFLKLHPETVTYSSYGCNANPPDIGGGSNAICKKVNGVWVSAPDYEERSWAAAELYKTTGDSTYNADFIAYWNQTGSVISGMDSHLRRASFAYVTIAKYPTDAPIVSKIKSAFASEGDYMQKRAGEPVFNNNLYRSCGRMDSNSGVGWGLNSQTSKFAWQLIKDYFLLGKASYLETAKLCFDIQLGNNPQYLSYITGVGHDYPMQPLQTPTLLDQIKEPVPGIPVYGPAHYLPQNTDQNKAIFGTDYLYPSGLGDDKPYPIMRRFFDNLNVMMAEFTIYDLSYSMAAFTYFSDIK